MRPATSLRSFVRVCLVSLLVGCTAASTREPNARYKVTVDGLADARAAGKRTYYLYPGSKDVSPNDLQFREFASYVHGALRLRGFLPSQDGTSADIVVFLSYGIGEPQTTYYSYPVFGTVGGQTSTFTASTYGSGGSAHTTGSVSTPARRGVVGTGVGSATSYTRWTRLEAVDVAAFMESQQVIPLWQTTAISSGSSGDLRRAFPVMVAAMAPHLASNTERQRRVTLRESSKKVAAVRGAATAEPLAATLQTRGAVSSKPETPPRIAPAGDVTRSGHPLGDELDRRAAMRVLTQLEEHRDYHLSQLEREHLVAIMELFENEKASHFRWASSRAPQGHELHRGYSFVLKGVGPSGEQIEVVKISRDGLVLGRDVR